MEGPVILTDILKSNIEYYYKLQGNFEKFCTILEDVLSNDARFTNIIFEKNEDIVYIRFLGRVLEIKYIFVVDGNENRKGYVECVLPSLILNDETQVIQRFNFDGDGMTEIPHAEQEDQYFITHRTDAVNILLHWLSLSVKDTFLT